MQKGTVGTVGTVGYRAGGNCRNCRVLNCDYSCGELLGIVGYRAVETETEAYRLGCIEKYIFAISYLPI